MPEARPAAAPRRLQTRAQFQIVLAGPIVARSAHFALHQLVLAPPPTASVDSGSSLHRTLPDAGPDAAEHAAKEAAAVARASLWPGVWLGALVPKRWARRAVTRNGIRRQIYAVGADCAAALPCAGHVVRLRTAFDRRHFVSAWSEPLRLAVRTELQQLFARATALGAGAPKRVPANPQTRGAASAQPRAVVPASPPRGQPSGA